MMYHSYLWIITFLLILASWSLPLLWGPSRMLQLHNSYLNMCYPIAFRRKVERNSHYLKHQIEHQETVETEETLHSMQNVEGPSAILAWIQEALLFLVMLETITLFWWLQSWKHQTDEWSPDFDRGLSEDSGWDFWSYLKYSKGFSVD